MCCVFLVLSLISTQNALRDVAQHALPLCDVILQRCDLTGCYTTAKHRLHQTTPVYKALLLKRK